MSGGVYGGGEPALGFGLPAPRGLARSPAPRTRATQALGTLGPVTFALEQISARFVSPATSTFGDGPERTGPNLSTIQPASARPMAPCFPSRRVA